MKIGPMEIRPPKSRKIKNIISKENPVVTLRKKRRLRYIAILPSFITLLNGACGFTAIVFTNPNQDLRWSIFFTEAFNTTSFALAGYMVIIAMIADMLDGRVARLTRTTSSFGGQLDSLSDAISFGVAPAFLMLKLVEHHLDEMPLEYSIYSVYISRVVFFIAVLYVMCAVVRLARFNVENEEDESAHMYFAGLPSPAAAGAVVSLVIFHQHFLLRLSGIIIVMILPVFTLFSGILMVSRIRYPHLPNQLLRRKKSLASLLVLFASLFFIVLNIQLALAAGFCGFVLYGVFRWVIVSVFRKKEKKEISA
jgi:CDP-diacylglycerol--serine O-phosphatidyltransferase